MNCGFYSILMAFCQRVDDKLGSRASGSTSCNTVNLDLSDEPPHKRHSRKRFPTHKQKQPSATRRHMRVLGCGGACDGCLGLLGASGRPPDRNCLKQNLHSSEASSSDEQCDETNPKNAYKSPSSLNTKRYPTFSVGSQEAGRSSVEENVEMDVEEESSPIHSQPLVGPGQSVAVSRTARATQRWTHPVGLFSRNWRSETLERSLQFWTISKPYLDIIAPTASFINVTKLHIPRLSSSLPNRPKISSCD